MYVIGLTGNIATGKSAVAAMLRALGAYVIDADELAHWAIRAGTPAHRRVVERFGCGVLRADGEVDRARLATVVFADARALADLEGIIHPVVVAESFRLLASSDGPVGAVEAIKLFEAGMHWRCDAVWVVTCSREQQVERLMRTRGMSRDEAELHISAQPPASAKLALASVVIDNSRTLEDAWRQVLRAWKAIPGAPMAPVDAPWPELTRRESNP
jgi:dephospho-CoA kinase